VVVGVAASETGTGCESSRHLSEVQHETYLQGEARAACCRQSCRCADLKCESRGEYQQRCQCCQQCQHGQSRRGGRLC
jgi:hypothetical protein